MIVVIVVALLVLGIAFYQVTQGLFSALIMAILSIICAAVALNYYEPLAQVVAQAFDFERNAQMIQAASLFGLFFVPLLVLRWLFDAFIRGNMVFGVWADRIGGGALGVVTGMVCVGILAVAAQMLPTGETVLGYRPFGPDLKRAQRLAPFYPDEFVVGMFRGLSSGAMSGDTRFLRAHDDLLLELYASRNTAGRNGRIDAKPDSMTGVRLFKAPDVTDVKPGDPTQWVKDVPMNPLLGIDQDRIYVVRTTVSAAMGDPDGWLRLPATNFRLTTLKGYDYYPVAYLTYSENKKPLPGQNVIPASRPSAAAIASRPAAPDHWRLSAGSAAENQAAPGDLLVARETKDAKTVTVDWVYRVRKDDEDRPAYVTFRRIARADVAKIEEWKEAPLRADALDRINQ
jgi:uncharacterized membrane protein required for colicin V production